MAHGDGVANGQLPHFNAPLFRSIFETLDDTRRCVVLDLGAARPGTVELFGRYRCRLEIADVADGLERLNGETDPQRLLAFADALLPEPRDEPFDAVLCWDILNYLDRSALSALMARVAARARRGTVVHALMTYADTHMPARPGQFAPQPDQTVASLAAFRHEREAPRYAPYDLTNCMHGYTLDRAMLLSNGMQEMLFRL